MYSLNSSKHKLILIGASTGGPGHIQKILENIEEGFKASIIIAQHMGKEYLPSFAKMLNQYCTLSVKMAKEGMICVPSEVYICSGQCVLQNKSIFSMNPSKEYSYNPDINILFDSVSKLTAEFEVLSVVLTGIGDDGAKGTQSLVNVGARCLAESKESSVVYGMSKRASEVSSQVEVKTLEEIIGEIKRFGS